MKSLKNLWVRIVKDEEGATMIEYALLAALISIAAIATISSVGKSTNKVFDTVDTKLGSGTGVPVP